MECDSCAAANNLDCQLPYSVARIEPNSREILFRDTATNVIRTVENEMLLVESKYLLVPTALGTTEADGGAEARERETRGSQEEGQARSQCERIYRGQATSSGKSEV